MEHTSLVTTSMPTRDISSSTAQGNAALTRAQSRLEQAATAQDDSERFMRIVQATSAVVSHYDLFIFLQSKVQHFIPHQIMLAAWGDFRGDSPRFDVVSALPGVRTDVLDVLIDSKGGDLVRADLRAYPVDKTSPDTPVRLLNDAPAERWEFQTGLRSAIGGAEPNHIAVFRTASNDYTLAEGQNELVVSLDWVGEGPVSARKVYTFKRGHYGIDLTLSVEPSAGGSWRGAPYAQMVRVHNPPKRSYTSVDSYSFTGPVLYNGDRYEKLDFKKITDTPITQTVKGGWLAAIQHHFLAAAVPPPGDEVRYNASTRGQEFVLSALGPVLESTAAMPLNYTYTLFVGPKLQDQLKAIGQRLDLTVDYGRLTLLSQPMFLVLSFIERWVDNWG